MTSTWKYCWFPIRLASMEYATPVFWSTAWMFDFPLKVAEHGVVGVQVVDPAGVTVWFRNVMALLFTMKLYARLSFGAPTTPRAPRLAVVR